MMPLSIMEKGSAWSRMVRLYGLLVIFPVFQMKASMVQDSTAWEVELLKSIAELCGLTE